MPILASSVLIGDGKIPIESATFNVDSYINGCSPPAAPFLLDSFHMRSHRKVKAGALVVSTRKMQPRL
eukprot:4582930-Amphidinium_carterae.1